VTSNISAYTLVAMVLLCAVAVAGAAGIILYTLYRLLWRHTGTRRRVRLDEADERWRAAVIYGEEDEPPYPPADRPMMMAPVEGRPPWELAHEPRRPVLELEPKPELVLQAPGGWISGPCLDVPPAEQLSWRYSPANSAPSRAGETILLLRTGHAVSYSSAAEGYGGEFDPDEDEGRPPWEPEPDAADYLAERTPAAEMWLIRWADRLPSWRIGLEPA